MFLQDFENSKNKEEIIFQYAISKGEFSFKEIKIENLLIKVFNDALKVEGIRIPVSANIQKRIAEHYNCNLLTSKIANIIFEKKDYYVPPIIGNPNDLISSKAITKHSSEIDNYRPFGLICNTGKHWITTPNNVTTNYGWFFEGETYKGIKGVKVGTYTNLLCPISYSVIQGIGKAHNEHHFDYSQTCTLVSRKCYLNGIEKDIRDILYSDDYHLISYEKF